MKADNMAIMFQSYLLLLYRLLNEYLHSQLAILLVSYIIDIL